jgi:hypothetical protein
MFCQQACPEAGFQNGPAPALFGERAFRVSPAGGTVARRGQATDSLDGGARTWKEPLEAKSRRKARIGNREQIAGSRFRCLKTVARDEPALRGAPDGAIGVAIVREGNEWQRGGGSGRLRRQRAKRAPDAVLIADENTANNETCYLLLAPCYPGAPDGAIGVAAVREGNGWQRGGGSGRLRR